MSHQTKEQKVKEVYPNAECIKHVTPKTGEVIYIVTDKDTGTTLGQGGNNVVAWYNAYVGMLQTV